MDQIQHNPGRWSAKRIRTLKKHASKAERLWKLYQKRKPKEKTGELPHHQTAEEKAAGKAAKLEVLKNRQAYKRQQAYERAKPCDRRKMQ